MFYLFVFLQPFLFAPYPMRNSHIPQPPYTTSQETSISLLCFSFRIYVTWTSGKFMLLCNKWMKKPWMVSKRWTFNRRIEGCEWGTKKKRTKEKEVLGEGTSEAFNDVMEKSVIRCLGVPTVRDRIRSDTDMLFSWNMLHQTRTRLEVYGQMLLIPVLASFDQLMWLDLVLLFHCTVPFHLCYLRTE